MACAEDVFDRHFRAIGAAAGNFLFSFGPNCRSQVTLIYPTSGPRRGGGSLLTAYVEWSADTAAIRPPASRAAAPAHWGQAANRSTSDLRVSPLGYPLLPSSFV